MFHSADGLTQVPVAWTLETRMGQLEPPDLHFLSSAVGWLELGNPTEAKAELDGISASNQEHPDVLELRWLIYSRKEDWPRCLEIARALVRAAPERSTSWLHQAYAMRRVPEGGVKQAWDVLLPAFDRFPTESTIAYNLSCYACQMQLLDDARLWLKRALAIGGQDRIKQMALDDTDLEPLWKEIPDY